MDQLPDAGTLRTDQAMYANLYRSLVASPPLAFECVRVVSAGRKCTNVPHAGRGRLGPHLVSAVSTRCLGACWHSLAYQPYTLGTGWQYVTAHWSVWNPTLASISGHTEHNAYSVYYSVCYPTLVGACPDYNARCRCYYAAMRHYTILVGSCYALVVLRRHHAHQLCPGTSSSKAVISRPGCM